MHSASIILIFMICIQNAASLSCSGIMTRCHFDGNVGNYGTTPKLWRYYKTKAKQEVCLLRLLGSETWCQGGIFRNLFTLSSLTGLTNAADGSEDCLRQQVQLIQDALTRVIQEQKYTKLQISDLCIGYQYLNQSIKYSTSCPSIISNLWTRRNPVNSDYWLFPETKNGEAAFFKTMFWWRRNLVWYCWWWFTAAFLINYIFLCFWNCHPAVVVTVPFQPLSVAYDVTVAVSSGRRRER